MQYFITFLEGITTFISPCMLPMLPVYVSYFSGGGEHGTKTTLQNALGFVGGFTLIFILMGAFAGTIGSFFKEHQAVFNVIAGILVILFGLNFLGVIKINLFHGMHQKINTSKLGFFSSVLMGIIFSFSWTPCVGAFVGSALVYASQQGKVLIGMGMLLCYSAGLGIPFVISAVLIDKLKTTFNFVKGHYRTVNIICGGFLILVGVLMATGTLGRLLSLFH